MKPETIEKIFNFLEEKEDKQIPELWFDLMKKLELVKELETHPDGTQYRHEGYLNLDGTNITKLPNDLYVDGILDLRSCQYLTELPNNLHVEGDLLLADCKELRGLPDNLYFDGTLDLRGCAKLKGLPDNLHVKGSLGLTDCSELTELPNNLHVEGDLYIYGTPLAKKYKYERFKYMEEEIRKIVASTGGKINGEIRL